jgi:Ca-activated chloride channel homolog
MAKRFTYGPPARTFFVIGLMFILVSGTDAADERVAITPRAPAHTTNRDTAPALRVNVKLTQIPVTVTDSLGATFLGLPQAAFRLFEDGVEQQIKYFTAEDGPVSMGVVFDASRSMEGRLDQSRAAVSQFFRTATTGDEYFLIEFNDTPRLLCDFTTDMDRIEKTLVNIKPKNWTALFDSVYMGIQQMRRAKNARKVLLVLSDGGDNNSRYSESEMNSLIREADVSIYSIGLVGGGWIKRHVQLLRRLADQTGGHFYPVEKMSDLPDAVAKVSRALRNQYVLGYSSQNIENDGLYRKIEVRLNQDPSLPALHASWRNGYYAPDAR